MAHLRFFGFNKKKKPVIKYDPWYIGQWQGTAWSNFCKNHGDIVADSAGFQPDKALQRALYKHCKK